MYIVVCFDVSDDRSRYRVVKTLKGCGHRVQKSVFECSSMTEKNLTKLQAALTALIDQTTDSIRYYKLCRSCLREVINDGLGMLPKEGDFEII